MLDSLRQPIETGEAVVARANAHVRFPARFQLVAAMNPCGRIAFLLPHVRQRLSARKERRYSEQPKSLADHLKKRRYELGHRQRDAADRIGIGADAYLLWETGRTKQPEQRYYPAILAYLGYDPFPPPQTLPERIAAKRRQLGITIKQAAALAGVDEGTFGRWANGEWKPKMSGGKIEAFLALKVPGEVA